MYAGRGGNWISKFEGWGGGEGKWYKYTIYTPVYFISLLLKTSFHLFISTDQIIIPEDRPVGSSIIQLSATDQAIHVYITAQSAIIHYIHIFTLRFSTIVLYKT